MNALVNDLKSGSLSNQEGGVKILIVEDEAVIALDIRLTVEKLGFKALGIAVSGEECLHKTEVLQPDVVLMDIKIKGEMDGVSTAEEVYRRFQIPIIYISAYMDSQTISRTESPASFGYLCKPFEPYELKDAIQRSIKRQYI